MEHIINQTLRRVVGVAAFGLLPELELKWDVRKRSIP